MQETSKPLFQTVVILRDCLAGQVVTAIVLDRLSKMYQQFGGSHHLACVAECTRFQLSRVSHFEFSSKYTADASLTLGDR